MELRFLPPFIFSFLLFLSSTLLFFLLSQQRGFPQEARPFSLLTRHIYGIAKEKKKKT